MADLTVPNTFAPNTQIKSAEVNANFTALTEGAFNKTDGDTCEGPAVFEDDVSVGGDLTVTGSISGTISAAAGTLTGTTLAANVVNSSLTAVGTVTTGSWYGSLGAISGANLTNLNAAQLTAGTVPDARFPATLPAASGVNLTALNATNLASGTVPDARFPATLPAASGANLTNLDASDLATGTVPAARLGSGTPSSTTWLRGDSTWNGPPAQTYSPLLTANFTAVGNVGGGTDTLQTYTLPGGTMVPSGYGVEIEAAVEFAANGNTKQAWIYFGATAVAATTSATHNNVGGHLRALVINNGSGQQAVGMSIVGAGTGTANYAMYTTPGETLSGPFTICTKGSGTDDNDIVSRLLIVRFIHVPS